MTDTPPDPRFTWVDVEQWADHGLIRPDQVTAIRTHVAGLSGPTPSAAHPRAMEITPRTIVRRPGPVSTW